MRRPRALCSRASWAPRQRRRKRWLRASGSSPPARHSLKRLPDVSTRRGLHFRFNQGRVARGLLEIGVDLESDAAEIVRLMNRYRDTPMSLADACLVRLAERNPDSRLFTLDSDFARYRRSGRRTLPLPTPDG